MNKTRPGGFIATGGVATVNAGQPKTAACDSTRPALDERMTDYDSERQERIDPYGYRDGATLRRLYWGEGMSYSDIADVFDVSPAAVQKWMNKNDIERRESGYHSTGDEPWRDYDTMHELYVERELSTRAVGEELGVDSTTVSLWLGNHGIDARSRGGIPKVNFRLDSRGYERIKCTGGEFRHHQLLAIAEGADPFDIFGGDLVVHHRNGIPWDNRVENLEVMSNSDHVTLHHEKGDINNNYIPGEDE